MFNIGHVALLILGRSVAWGILPNRTFPAFRSRRLSVVAHGPSPLSPVRVLPGSHFDPSWEPLN